MYSNAKQLGIGALLVLMLSACGGGGGSSSSTAQTVDNPGSNAQAGSINVLSNRADLISGRDALVEVVLPDPSDASRIVMTLNNEDVSQQFALRENGRYMAQLEGLALGNNVLIANISGATSQVSIFNHPNGGPIFAGPQPQPWTCSNAAVAVDAACNQSAEYSFLYKSTDPMQTGLQPYDPDNPPSDVAMTTTQQGQTLPFIVRQELGYQDRDQYLILMLFNPDDPWAPWAPQPQWNQKLLITHGGGCGVTFEDGRPRLEDYSGTIPSNPAVEQSYINALGLGFAVASTALDNLGHDCNTVTQAESLMMVKERLVEQYGELRYTLGTGCSGGSITQQQVANAYPDIYQGLIVTCSYADVFTTAVQFAEYHLLRPYFENPDRWSVPWSPTQFADVEGHVSHANAVAADEAFFKEVTDPSNPSCSGISAGQGPEKLYDAQNNPGGVRCDLLSYAINVFGPRPPEVWSINEQMLGRGFAALPVDNVGVQYGLSALRQGLILPEQFVDVNAKIGGLDVDFLPQAERVVADPQALAFAYRTGAINVSTYLDRVPIIDGRGPDPGIAHDAVHVFMLRARLDQVHGNHDNQVIWEGPVPLIGDAEFANTALLAMDRWLAAIELDTSATPLPQKVVANKPTDIADACYNGSGTKVTDGLCPDAVVPVYSTPRIVAGDSLMAVTNKCQLKPLDRSDDYGVVGFTDAQWTRMQATFSDGVCDFSQPPVAYQPTLPWLSFQDAAGQVIYGGERLPAPPVNSGGGWASPAFAVFTPLR